MCPKQEQQSGETPVHGFQPEFRETLELNEQVNCEAKCLCSNTEKWTYFSKHMKIQFLPQTENFPLQRLAALLLDNNACFVWIVWNT